MKMISFQEALELIKSKVRILPDEAVDLQYTPGRILAEDVHYDSDLPPFNKSAMDGFACRSEDLEKELQILETIYAGFVPRYSIGPGQCAKIMTGGVVPEGADCVFMKEIAEVQSDDRVLCLPGKSASNICLKGEDVKLGDLALAKGTLINSRHIPLMAGAGISKPRVFKQPEVALFSTGSELVEVTETPLPHQIRNSNGPQLLSQLAAMGIKANYRGIIKDSEQETEKKIRKIMDKSDLFILSGGVSEGDSDYIPRVLEKLGFELYLTSSAIQPGKPVIFAQREEQFCFGLAGNPVSSYVQFEYYIKPFLYGMMGHDYHLPSHWSIMGGQYRRKKTERLKFIPAFLDGNNVATPVEYNGSAHIEALGRANCLMDIPVGVAAIYEGERVHVRPLS